MSTTNFAVAINNIATTVATDYTSGSGKLYVASTTGITLTGSQWVRVSTFRSGSPLSILEATAVGSDAGGSYLTIAGGIDGYTDVNLLVGDAAELRVTAGAFNDLATAVNKLEDGANLQNKPTAVVATTAPLAANTYANAASGVGATLTANSNGALAAIDGYTPVLNDLILVKDESTGAHNGLYSVTQVGGASVPYILTRSVAMDSSAKYVGASILVGPSGTTNGKTLWECTNTSVPTVGTDGITFGQVGGGVSDMLSVLVNTPVSITGTTALTSTAFGKMHICSGTSSNYTVTLPSPTGQAGKFIGFQMSSALTKLVTIAHNASENVDGVASRIMWANEVAILRTDGADWFKISGRSMPMGCVMYMLNSGNQYSVASSTQTPLPIDSFINNDASSVLMADTTNHRINILRPSTYFISGVSSFVSFAANSTNTQTSIWRNYSTNEEALTSAYAASGSDRTIYTAYVTKSPAAGDTISLVAYQNSGSACNSLNTIASFLGLNNLTVTEIISW